MWLAGLDLLINGELIQKRTSVLVGTTADAFMISFVVCLVLVVSLNVAPTVEDPTRGLEVGEVFPGVYPTWLQLTEQLGVK